MCGSLRFCKVDLDLDQIRISVLLNLHAVAQQLDRLIERFPFGPSVGTGQFSIEAQFPDCFLNDWAGLNNLKHRPHVERIVARRGATPQLNIRCLLLHADNAGRAIHLWHGIRHEDAGQNNQERDGNDDFFSRANDAPIV